MIPSLERLSFPFGRHTEGRQVQQVSSIHKRKAVMEKRITPGRFIPTGDKRDVWSCRCGYQGTTACGKTNDGEAGLWCPKCMQSNVKNSLKTIRVDVTRWQRGIAEVKCCGAWLLCHSFTNTCSHCERDFNSSGQLLAPRSQWGEETGESLPEILSIT